MFLFFSDSKIFRFQARAHSWLGLLEFRRRLARFRRYGTCWWIRVWCNTIALCFRQIINVGDSCRFRRLYSPWWSSSSWTAAFH